MLNSVMVVDDESSIRSAVEQWLSLSGFQVQLFSRADECLAQLPRHFAGVILSDVRMPVTNGFELFEKVRSIPRLKKVPFVFMSSLDDYDAKRTAKVLGADDYIEKPFDLDYAKTIILNLLMRFRTKQQT